MNKYNIKMDENGEYFIEGGPDFTMKVINEGPAHFYHPAISQLAEYDAFFASTPKAKKFFEVVKNLIQNFTYEELIDLFSDVHRTAEKLDKKLQETQLQCECTPVPVHIGDTVYEVQQEYTAVTVNVARVLDAQFSLQLNAWRVLIQVYGRRDSWWSDFDKSCFLKIEDAIAEQQRLEEVEQANKNKSGSLGCIH